MQVSKAFSEDFAYPIWHTIDFGTQAKVDQIYPTISNNYGQHIRVVEGVKEESQVGSLINLGVTSLSELEVVTEMDPLFQASLYDLIRKNRATLTKLKIHRKSGKRKPSSIIFLDSLMSTIHSLQPSKLSHLSIQWLTLTRDSLTSVLRCCPVLIGIDLWGVTLIPSRKVDDYQHAGVKVLETMVADSIVEGNPPLLAHFPNLDMWKTGDSSLPSEFPSQRVKDIISTWCPTLRCVESNFMPSPLLTHLIVNVFDCLTSLTFDYRKISPEMILALLHRPDNWIHLDTYVSQAGFYSKFEDDGIPEVMDHFQSSRWMVQSIMRCCRNLESFGFQDHEMDLDEIEQIPWVCEGLEDLKVRIKGLDTRDMIEGAISKWRVGRKERGSGDIIEDPVDQDQSIEARVARHLLRFKNLSTVWLGSKIWEL
ncbi:hypothetical protein BGZ79_000919 [Entomortierella chlamydospora]|nr:hypothetical protein BGZ79_000919 [Entomortierella chlamydospora]